MKKTTILIYVLIVVILLMVSLLVSAKLSDDTLELVEDLRWKHYHYYKGEVFGLVSITGDDIVNPIFIDDMWTDTFLSMWVEDGTFYVETQDGKWFIKMEKVNE